MKTYIQNFIVYLSDSSVSQEKGSQWLAEYLQSDLVARYAVKPDYISSRHAFAPGIADLPFEGDALYNLSNDNQSNPLLNKRSELAQKKVNEIFQSLYKKSSQEVEDIPDHLFHVSCTHYQSPSGAQKLVLQKQWYESTTVTHLYHMGCYAALPAIRSARSSLIDGSLKADVVHTELCSYHLDKNNVTAEQIVMNTLFADGAIKYSVVNQSDPQTRALEIITLKEVLVPYSENEMTWKLGAHGFMMTLTRNVPLLLAREIEQYMRNLFLKAGFDFDRDKNDFLFAIHPGGPKIIELVQKVLKLYESQVSHSKKILFQRGNMSSATLPHIWNEILNDEQTPSGKPVVTVAFGPGLTMTGAIFKVCGP